MEESAPQVDREVDTDPPATEPATKEAAEPVAADPIGAAEGPDEAPPEPEASVPEEAKPGPETKAEAAPEAEAGEAPGEVEAPDPGPPLGPSKIESGDLGSEPPFPPGFEAAARAAVGDATAEAADPSEDVGEDDSRTQAPAVRFVQAREMLIGWRPRRVRKGRAYVTYAELQLAGSIAGLAVVMLIVGFVGLFVIWFVGAGALSAT